MGRGENPTEFILVLQFYAFVARFMCTSVLLAHLSVHHVHAWHPQMSEEEGPMGLELQMVMSNRMGAGN